MSDVASRKGKKDQYANIAFGSVTASAANTLTYSQIQLAVGIFQGLAMILHRILWYPWNGTLRENVAATDQLSLALTTSNRLTSIGENVNDPAMIQSIHMIGIGVAIASVLLPIISDFTMLPGGGKLVSPNPLYLGITSAGAVGAVSSACKLEFTFVELSDRDYLELIQTTFPANIL